MNFLQVNSLGVTDGQPFYASVLEGKKIMKINNGIKIKSKECKTQRNVSDAKLYSSINSTSEKIKGIKLKSTQKDDQIKLKNINIFKEFKKFQDTVSKGSYLVS